MSYEMCLHYPSISVSLFIYLRQTTSMRPTLPPAPPIRQPYWHAGHALTVDDFFYGIGMLAALAVAGTSACAAGAILHAQTCHVQAAPGLQVPSARQAPTSTGDRKGLPMSCRRACQREKRVFTVSAVSGHAMPSPRTPPPKPAMGARRVPARPRRQLMLWNGDRRARGARKESKK